MSHGNVTGCLRKPGREPKQAKVHWHTDDADAFEEANTPEGVCTPPCAACPIQDYMFTALTHSMRSYDTCKFDFESIADANRLAGLFINDTTDDILQGFQTFLTTTTPTSSSQPSHADELSVETSDLSHCLTVRDAHFLSINPGLKRLHRVLQEHGQINEEEDGPELSIVTWLLDGQLHQRCRHPRQLLLDRWVQHWANDFRKLWQDRTHPTAEISAHVVHPEPMTSRDDNHIHVILTQREPVDQHAALLSMLFDGESVAYGHFARFCSPEMFYDDLVLAYDIQQFCPSRDCVFHTDTTMVHQDATWPLPTYNGLCIRSQISATDQPAADDETVWMQTFSTDPLLQENLRLTQLTPNWERPWPMDPVQHDHQEDEENSDHPDNPTDEETSNLDIDDVIDQDAMDEIRHTHLFRRTRRHVRDTITDAMDDPDAFFTESAAAWGDHPDQIREHYFAPALTLDGPVYISEFHGDRDPASSDKLVLVDTIFHFNDVEAAPAQDRRARLLPQHLGRFRLLFICHVSHHCMLEHDRCIVKINNDLWPGQDLMVTTFASGSLHLPITMTPRTLSGPGRGPLIPPYKQKRKLVPPPRFAMMRTLKIMMIKFCSNCHR